MQNHIAVALVVVVLTLGGVFLLTSDRDSGLEVPSWVTHISFSTTTAVVPDDSKVPVKKISSRITTTPGVERWYTHETPRFSFRLPDGFSAPDIDTGTKGVSGVRVSNEAGAELVAYVYPVSSGTRVDPNTIKSYFTEQVITGIQETGLGTLVRGYRFYATERDGSRLVHLWAAYNGYVYTVQARVEDEDLFNFVTGNWFFTPPTSSAPQKK